MCASALFVRRGRNHYDQHSTLALRVLLPPSRVLSQSLGAIMGAKRKTDAIELVPASKRSASTCVVDSARVKLLKPAGATSSCGPVVYWMSRDQRAADNWALLHAADRAASAGVPVCVVFNLVPSFVGAGARQMGFMLRGLRGTAAALNAQGVPFHLLRGAPKDTLPAFCQRLHASLLVTDFSPLRVERQWKDDVVKAVSCPVHQVDAHNVVPVWSASPKLEYAARTIRPKITGLLPTFLTDFPPVPATPAWPAELPAPAAVDWDALISEASADQSVPEVRWCVPGEAGGAAALASFLSPQRLRLYAEKRNDPCVPSAQSGLSPWLHFGQLAPQRAALAARALAGSHPKAVEGFLEELVVRRELSDNFCLHNPSYDSLAGASAWARESLEAHKGDKREFLYTTQQLETAKTDDRLWNAAQLELVHLGKMHGFMRMYWAKKILEWTATPEQALADAIFLNDKYSLDGRDPNGFVGCMWSIAGVHDMGWAERPVFGKARFQEMNVCLRVADARPGRSGT